MTTYTPGPWRSVRVRGGQYFTHQIEIAEGHLASVVGWTKPGVACLTTQANVKLIEHAPDMAEALRDLLGWETVTGEWQAPCWKRAEVVLEHAMGARSSEVIEPIPRTSDMLGEVSRDTQLALLLGFLDAEAARDPVLARRLQAHLRSATAAIGNAADGP